jgi:parallel beta-helix repeat protein
MKLFATVALAAIMLVPAMSSAQTCPDMNSLTIPAPWAGAEKCISTVAKASTKFVASKLKAQDKCRKARQVGACVDTTPASGTHPFDDGENGDPIRRDNKTTDKIIKALSKAGDQIAKKCSGTDVASFPNSYAGIEPDQMAECLLGQNNATAALIAWSNNGASAPILELGTCTGGGRDGEPCADASGCPGGVCDIPKSKLVKCVDKFASSATKMVQGVLKAVNKCVDTQIKAGTTSNLAASCVGSYSGGVFTPPTDAKAAGQIAKAQDKAQTQITKQCGALSADEIKRMNACPDAEDLEGLRSCMECDNWSRISDLIEQQYSETGTYVSGTGSGNVGLLQAAWSSAVSGEKFLVAPDTYTSDPGDGGLDDSVITMAQTGTCNGGDTPGATCATVADCAGAAISCDGASPTGVSFVGCVDTATGDRPVIEPDGSLPSHGNGVFAAGVDGLTFQSLSVFDWGSNGVFVTGADGVVFRDIYGHGGTEFSTYAVFPVSSENILVEGCFVTNVDDAGIYVGSSNDYTIRWNLVTDSVAGIEVENSFNTRTHNNESYGNTGGLLTFMLLGPPQAASFNNDADHNVLVENNTSNFGSGSVGAVPDGSGYVIVATDDSEYTYNYIAGNNSSGIAVVDQLIFSILSEDPGDCCSFSCESGGVPSGVPCTTNADCSGAETCENQQENVRNLYANNILDNNGASIDPDLIGVVPPNTQNVMIISGPPDHNNCFAQNTLIVPAAVDASLAETFIPDNDCTP